MAQMQNTLSAFIKYEEAESRYSRDDVTVASGQNLATGQIVGRITASGKVAAYNKAAADGTQTAAGILTAAVNASAGDAPGVIIARHAVAAKEALVFTAGTSQPDKDSAFGHLKSAGIVCRATV